MGVDNLQNHQILFFHCSITCIYFTGILIYLHFSNVLDNIVIYKFIYLLPTLVFVELIKLLFTSCKTDYLSTGKLDPNNLTQSKKTFLKTVKDVLKLILAIILLTIIYHIIIVLYGAPLFTHYVETLMLAVTLTTLTLTPATLHLGTDNALSLFTDLQQPIRGTFVDAVKLNIKAVLLATWLSAFVLPLDWDRPWQIWPIPCIMGALIGYFTAHFITFVKIFVIKWREKSKKNELKTC